LEKPMPEFIDDSTEFVEKLDKHTHVREDPSVLDIDIHSTTYTPISQTPRLLFTYRWKDPFTFVYVAKVDSNEAFIRDVNMYLRANRTTSVDSSG
jgi:hypothetical protein